jgi:hypothetical protein
MQGSVAAAAAAQMPLPHTPSTRTSQMGSPSLSMASSAADSGAIELHVGTDTLMRADTHTRACTHTYASWALPLLA